MERWGHSLTVLLEKEFGNIYIEKMQAICLMEADFNWLNKLVFAKRMMNQAYDAGLVPDEQFAKANTQASYGVLRTVQGSLLRYDSCSSHHSRYSKC